MIPLAITMVLLQVPCSGAAPRPTAPAPLIVEVVDPGWLPRPGVEVKVTSQGRRRESWRAITGEDGAAPFWVGRPGKYVIEADIPGFKKRRLKNVTVGVASPTPVGARVQLRLTFSGPTETVYSGRSGLRIVAIAWIVAPSTVEHWTSRSDAGGPADALK